MHVQDWNQQQQPFTTIAGRSRARQPKFALISALLLAGALSGCATMDQKCEAGGCSGDAKITAQVQANLQKHPELQGVDRIHVQTMNHVVYLTGQVSEGLQARTAEDVARQTQGVTKVESTIYVIK